MSTSERKLTPREEKRKQELETLSIRLMAQGYERKDLTVSIAQANVWAFLLGIPFSAVLLFAFFKVGNYQPKGSISFAYTYGIFVIGMVFLIVLHELIHGLVWGCFAKKHFKSIEFGIIWKSATPYCTCSDPLKKWQYVIGALMPTLILGFGLGAVSVVLGNLILCGLAVVLIFGGGGDFLIIIKALSYKSDKKEQIFLDHPYECGLVVFER